jgi:hypothetical protein
MPLLQVRDFPEDMYQALIKLAKAEHRTVPQQTVVLMSEALDMKLDAKARQRAAFETFDRLRPQFKNIGTLPDPVDLIREDRDR